LEGATQLPGRSPLTTAIDVVWVVIGYHSGSASPARWMIRMGDLKWTVHNIGAVSD